MAVSKKKQNLWKKAERARAGYKRSLLARQANLNETLPNQPDIQNAPVQMEVDEPPTPNEGLTTPSATDPALEESGNEPTQASAPVETTPCKFRPPTLQEAKIALQSVSNAIRSRRPNGDHIYHDLDRTTRDRFTAMRACLSNFLASGCKYFLPYSIIAARGQEKKATYARSIRRWIRDLIETGDLPYFRHGWWNVPLLGDEDIGREIKEHLQRVGKYACAEDIVKFFSDEATRTRLGVSRSISLRTAQRWMLKYGGFRWRTELKGQYIDGHERADVVAYRQNTYIPFMRALEHLTTIYNEHGVPDPQYPIVISPDEKPVIIWFHDESIFFANDRQLVRWVGADEQATPFKKGEGITIMVADFVCAQFGWLKGKNGESARVIFRPGINRDGWFNSAKVVKQLENAIKIVQDAYPGYTHKFVYDNAPSHTKRPEDAVSARTMPKGETKVFPRPVSVKKADGTIEKVTPPRMEPGRLPDGTLQSFYLPDDHEEEGRRGSFKGMAQILQERGLYEVAEKRAECPGFKCEPGRIDCCCRRALYNQPDFESRDSNLEEAARKLETEVIFLPKYHCELNPIEQCWGYAKRKYRQMPPTNKENVMIKYITDAMDSIPIESIRKFAARSQRFIVAYASGRSGGKAIEWATKKFRSHRQTPAHIPYEEIAPEYTHVHNNTLNG